MPLHKLNTSSVVAFFLIVTVSQFVVGEESGARFEDSDLTFGGFQTDDTMDEAASAADINWGGESSTQEASVWDDWVWQPSRFTLEHRYGYKFKEPKDVYQNRSSVRIEYNKFFLDHYYLILDAKTTRYWSEDHLRPVENITDSRLDKAYLQASYGSTSIGLGVQTVAWGESQLSPITDVISPRDNREFANFDLEELRLGQGMLTVNHYADTGRFSLIFVPDPKFNQNPEQGSPYYFMDEFTFQEAEKEDTNDRFEYGFRWGKTFGNVDLSLMAASLMDNDYALQLDDATGVFIQNEDRFDMYGMTFNVVSGKFLWKGEFGAKLGKSFNDASFAIVERDLFDTYLGFEYTYDTTTSVSMELVNQYIHNWSSDIQTERNRQQAMVTLTKEMLNDDLTVNLLTVYSRPASGYLMLITSEYQCSDNTSMELNLVFPTTEQEESVFWNVRDQRQISVALRYSF